MEVRRAIATEVEEDEGRVQWPLGTVWQTITLFFLAPKPISKKNINQAWSKEKEEETERNGDPFDRPVVIFLFSSFF